VVGCNIGRAQVAAFRELPECFDLRAVCDLDLGRAQSVAADFGVPTALDDYAALCERSDIDVISLCTPPKLHCEQILHALAAGKEVICEKPLVGSLAEIDRLAAAQVQFGRRIMPIFQVRFGRGLQKLKYLSDQGLTGAAYLATAETAWRRRGDYYATAWRGNLQDSLGGCLVQQGIHAHDACSFILGPPEAVFAFAATRVNPVEPEDCATASVRMRNGSLATFSVTLGSAEEITRHRFCFEHLTAESNTSAYGSSRDPWRFIGQTPEDERAIAGALGRFVPALEGYAGQFQRYHRALAFGGPLPVNLDDARASLELLTALYLSIETARPVTVAFDRNHPRYAGWLPASAGR